MAKSKPIDPTDPRLHERIPADEAHGLPSLRDKADAQQLQAEIDSLLGMPEANWAADTLRGIYDSIASKGYCTVGQRTAVTNIREATERRLNANDANRRGRWGRRYEGS